MSMPKPPTVFHHPPNPKAQVASYSRCSGAGSTMGSQQATQHAAATPRSCPCIRALMSRSRIPGGLSAELHQHSLHLRAASHVAPNHRQNPDVTAEGSVRSTPPGRVHTA